MASPGKSTNGKSEDGRLVENVMHFARVLRTAGLPIGPGRVLDAINAMGAIDITNRAEFYWALHATMVSRRDQREIFDQAFHMFWRNPDILERMMALNLPVMEGGAEPEAQRKLSRRVAEAFKPGFAEVEEHEEIEVDAALTYSAQEVLRTMDFESMSADEVAQAKAVIARMRLPVPAVTTRRFQPAPAGGAVDMRATLRAALRSGGDIIPLRYRKPRRRTPPLVVLCDISGSMARYSRMLLHFLHAVTNDRDRVHTFLFGTRLTNVTRYLRYKDIDVALDKISEVVEDWSGGTRIGHCLHRFNHDWSRRVLSQGAVVLLISDGLDRDAGVGLVGEMERLHKSCRRLIWLNPLLRYEGFQPKSLGTRAMLPHVDEFRPVHNLDSLTALAEALSRPAPRRQEGVSQWLEAI
jgi:uncharacterized protein with von Willebrand factor type A (vWA) domain